MNEKHIGTNFDDFLKEEKLLKRAEAIAEKRVFGFQPEKEKNSGVLPKSSRKK